ncbi:MAG TPA: phosphoglucosamine mutase [Thermoanaerobaculia bacterium]|nr:phosphoglucosamine mutase [Thermoanaerobaculia bacterium]
MKLFGTDGLRGRAGEFPLDAASVRRLGRELGRRLAGSGPARLVIGGDTRESTPRIVADMAAGLMEAGCNVASAGVITTPGVAELVLELGARAGVAVSASHNPYEDNGIKIFGPDGRKWPDAEEEYLENRLLEAAGAPPDPSPTPAPPDPDPGLIATYVSRLMASLPDDLEGFSVLLDAGNGAAFQIGPRAFRRCRARVTAIYDAPDGRNINRHCGALHPEAMARATRESGAALGVAFDGDADRSIFADENGRILDGDDVLWIVARAWKERGTLPPGGVVGTVMSNYGLEAGLAREGIAFQRAAVGDRNVARLMDETGAALGGETSGHTLLAPLSPAGDGILTALILSSIVKQSGKRLSELATLEKIPQTLRNVRVARRVPIDESPKIAEGVARAESGLRGRGRVFLRYSGTEPLLRILVEGPDAAEVKAVADALEATVRAELDGKP